MEFEQPQSFDNWIRKTGSQDPAIPKCKPCYHHFLKVMPVLYQCKPKRITADRCNGCQQIKILLSKAETVEEEERLNKLSDDHLHRAAVCYQLNSHFKGFSTDSFKSKSFKVTRLPNSEMKYPDTYVHYEIDYDVDHPECISSLNMAYFKSQIGMKTANIIQSPSDEFGSRKVHGWSGLHGGKAVEEITQCLEHCFQKRSIAAERCGITLDGALLTYKMIQFIAFNVYPKNPNRYFRSAVILSPETGHSRLEADTINSQSKRQYAKRSSFSTCKQRLEYLDESTNIETHQFSKFATLHLIFYQFAYECAESKIWNEASQKYEWISHPDELWLRCDEDLKQPLPKLRIFSEVMNELSRQDLEKVQRSIKQPPAMKIHWRLRN